MLKVNNFSYLHQHSKMSMLDAIPSVEEWCIWALENDIPAISITDHGTAISLQDILLFPKFIEKYNKKHGTTYPLDKVTGVPGVEFYFKLRKDDKKHTHLNAWAINKQGYHNLIKLSSLAFNDTVKYWGVSKARITLNQLIEYREGLRFGTACIGSPMGEFIMAGKPEEAKVTYELLYTALKEHIYIEFHASDLTHDFDNKDTIFKPREITELCPDGNVYKTYNQFLLKMVKEYGGKPIAVTDAHFIKPEDKIYQDILLMNSSKNGWHFKENYSQKTPTQIYDKLKEHLGDDLNIEMFNEWGKNADEIAYLAKDIKIKYDYHLPEVEIPETYKNKYPDKDNQLIAVLVEKVIQNGRWIEDPIYIDRFKKELEVIAKNGVLNFIPYFLLFEDICSFAKAKGILQGPARGSAGGSLISYYLKIIHIDPIKNNLPFERFLSVGRIKGGSFPDIDSDFNDKKEIFLYLKEKYGKGFAQIATFLRMKIKTAIKDVAFALYHRNRNDIEINGICKIIPDSPQGVDEYDFIYGYTDQEDNYNPGIYDTIPELKAFFDRYPAIKKAVDVLVGNIRGVGRHASGIVISSFPIEDRIPTSIVTDSELGEILVTQYEAKMVEKAGFVKADILKVSTLSTIKECLEMVKQRHNKDFMIEDNKGMAEIFRLPEDKNVYFDFHTNQTDSSYQFSSNLAKQYLPLFKPNSWEDLSIFTSLIRPGALDAPMEDTTATQYYVEVKNGMRALNYLHPDLEFLLKETNGIFCYQEQIMQFLVDLIGYTLEEADLIRSAIGKKKREVILASFTRIRETLKTKGWTEDQADKICDQIQAFSSYSFNRAHARAYSYLAYVTMYLKHHFYKEWWTATLNTHTGKEEKLKSDLKHVSHILNPVCVKNPITSFQIIGDMIACPLTTIKGIGEKVIAELSKHQGIVYFEDFLNKIDHRIINIGIISSLFKAGAFNNFMDPTDYATSRLELVNKYTEFRRSKNVTKKDIAEIDIDLLDVTPLSIFLQEKEVNSCFNKTILEDHYLKEDILKTWKSINKTSSPSFPFEIDYPNMVKATIIKNIETLMKAKDFLIGKEIGMIVFYEESTFKKGVSKKSGKEWRGTFSVFSDGTNNIDCIQWDTNCNYRYPKNSIIYVYGTVQNDFRGNASISIKELNRISLGENNE